MRTLESMLDALLDGQDALEAFLDCERQANRWLKDHTTDELVKELREAKKDCRRMRLGTINTLILLKHIDRLEAEVRKDPVEKP